VQVQSLQNYESKAHIVTENIEFLLFEFSAKLNSLKNFKIKYVS